MNSYGGSLMTYGGSGTPPDPPHFEPLWPSDGKIHFTYLGTMCKEDCKLVGHEYKCESIDKDGDVQSMYCSPKANTDYWGRECRKCGMGKEEYYWCRPDDFHWGYCGMVTDNKIYYGSTTGAVCHNNCDQIYHDYYWCNTAEGWDYCSPSENRDYMNKQCREDRPCGKYDKNYNWCRLKEGSWGYCGLVKPKTLVRRTKYDHFCVDKCQRHEKKDYYWCHTASSWDYCSPDVDVTYKNKPCRSDHSCDSHGYSYNWCWTSESDYDYCGPIERL
ncbi:hypothetical protein DPX16_15102 [Anabarilius grahami]|uniref:Uncharacterized protein n=1 Tax=Anabarilius grahami TaxID=495550 RepID=A0A3N0YYV0_ANAGA|nr:hypothetical protein DPX16_15102 [Anabarilius grahami]